MPAKTIIQAIVEVLQKEKRPLSIREITEQVVENNLYMFKTVNPDHVVGTQLRRHCDNITLTTSSKDKYFTSYTQGTYGLKK